MLLYEDTTRAPRISPALLEALGEEIANRVDDAFHKWATGAIDKLLRSALRQQTDRSIDGFCKRWGICRSFFYLLQRDGTAPAIMVVNGRRLISPEAEARWNS